MISTPLQPETEDRFGAWVCGNRDVMARRPDTLSGLPIGVKDVIATRDYPTQCGTPLPQSVIRELLEVDEAACVSDLKRAGAVVAGKTVTAELATYQPGPTVNPWSVKRTPGGSSSGSAAAVAAGDVRLSLATQTAGSTIRPASFCGLYGFKPSFGRYDLTGVLGTSPTLDTLGLMADELSLIEAADAVLAGSDARRAGVSLSAPSRLVLYRSANWARLPQEHQQRIDALAQRLVSKFSEYHEQDPVADLEALIGHQQTVHAGELANALGWLVTDYEELVSDTFKRFIMQGRDCGRSTLDTSVRAIHRARNSAHEYIHPDAVWLTPAVTSVAPPLKAGTGDPLFCRQWTALGVPCLTVPLWRERLTGLPFGPQLIAARGADRQLIEVGRMVMEQCGGGE